MGCEKPITGAERVPCRRAALRAQGLRPRTFWLPDPKSPSFIEQARRDCEAINAMRDHEDRMAYIEAIQYCPEDEYDWGPGGPP